MKKLAAKSTTLRHLFLLAVMLLCPITLKAEVVVEWDKTFGGSGDDRASAIISTPDGGLIVAGYGHFKGAGYSDVWVLKLDGQGQLQWDKTFEGNEQDKAFALISTPDGGLVVAGHTAKNKYRSRYFKVFCSSPSTDVS